MKRFLTYIILACLFAFSGAVSAYANIENMINNGGFESPIGGAGNWDNTAGRGISIVTGGAPQGTSFLRLSEATTLGGQFTFTFQVVQPVSAGTNVSIGALIRPTVVDDANDRGEVVIEFKNAANVKIGEVIAGTRAPVGTFNRVRASGIAPPGTAFVAFVLRIQNGEALGASIFDFDEVQANWSPFPVDLQAQTSRNRGSRGDIVPVAVRVENTSADKLRKVELYVDPQEGINMDSEEGSLDGVKVVQRQGSVIYQLGDLGPGQESQFVAMAILTSAIKPGKTYDITLFARIPSGPVSQTIHIKIAAEPDPVFDEGTIIGKVFNDLNQDTVQQKGEKGVPKVRLVTEEGIVVITDEHGRYHIPAVKPGRHIVKIDGHTLPEGTKFITEESYLVKTTPGILNKANFAVLLPPSSIPKEFEDDLQVMITQGLDTSRPTLAVQMDPDLLKVGIGVLEKDASFKFRVNFSDFVKKWFLEIRDELGREVWIGFGVGKPPAEVVWSGQMEDGRLIRPGIYSYQLKVEDKNGHQNWTPLHFFRVLSKNASVGEEKLQIEIPTVGDFNIFKDGKQSIPLVAKPTIRVQGTTKPDNEIEINGYPVDVHPETGAFETEMYSSPGEKEVVVTATNPEGQSTSFREKVKVKNSLFFMVALAEEELGINFTDGELEAVGQDDRFKDGFYEDGRVSFYLKGKLHGKFLVKVHYDTDDTRSALFTNLDQDDYYPVYGDNSSIDYEAHDTQDRLFVLVEFDRSFAKWGSFKTGFTDTELATYNRTLNGLKMHYETVGTTPYGDPNRGFKLFWTQSESRGSHDELAATGGTLYYLRNRDVIEGSEKIRVEVRDKIQNISIGSYDLQEGKDYEIDYEQGRILLSRPLSSVAASDVLVSHDILDGNQVYLIVDYEFNAGFNAFETSNRGIRGYTHLGDHLKVGGTAVEEQRRSADYELRAVDATLKFGRNTKITAEYAETQLQQVNQAVSFNGGLSYADLSLLRGKNTRPRENAYLIKAESKPIKQLELSGYVQAVEPGFSTDSVKSQEGTKKYGVNILYRVNENLFGRYRFDSSEVVGQLLPVEEHGITAPFEKTHNHTAQVVYNDGKWLAQAEYRRQVTDLPKQNVSPSLLSELPFENAIAGKLGYQINDRLLPYVKVQVTADSEQDNHQFGGGFRYELTKDLFAYLEQMFGSIGDSTYFGFEKHHGNASRSYANIKMIDRGIGHQTLTTSVGSSFSISEKSRVYSEREHSSYNGIDGFADILGFEGRAGDHWDYDLKFERRHLDNSSTSLLDIQSGNSLLRSSTYNTISGALAYARGDKIRARTALEIRFDPEENSLWQWVHRSSLDYKISDSLAFRTKLDYSVSRFTDPEDKPASFIEFTTGLAFRPIHNDKLNILARYTYVKNLGNDIQFQSPVFLGVELDEESHILAVDFAYDLHKYVGIVEKIAYKNAIVDTNLTQDVILHNFLWAHRFNIHVTRKWDLVLEYRALWQHDAAETLRHGAVIEVDRELYDYVRLGLGYNFTDFDDDLRKSASFDAHGPFVRLTGKF